MAKPRVPHSGRADKLYYVYIYRDPRDGSPLYVGKGRRYRHIAHMQLKRHKNAAFAKALSEIAALGLSPAVEILSRFDDEEEAFRAEALLIAKIGRRITGKGPLLNVDPGGNGGRRRAPSTIAKLKARSETAWKTPEVRQRLEAAAKERTSNPEARARLSRQAKDAWKDPAYAEARARDAAERWRREEYRSKVEPLIRSKRSDPDYRSRMSARKATDYGTDEFRQRMAAIKAEQYSDPSRREQFRARRRATMEARGLWKPNTK